MDEKAEEKPYSPKRGLSAVKLTLLGIFSAPIVAPLAIAAGCNDSKWNSFHNRGQ